MPRDEGRTLADEWFDDFIRRKKIGDLLHDSLPQHADRVLARERAYDAETNRLLNRIHNHTIKESRRA